MQVVAHVMGKSIFDADGELLARADSLSDSDDEPAIVAKALGRLWKPPA